MNVIEIGVVVNYYNPTRNIELIHQTILSALSYKNSGICVVNIVDGSGFINENLRDYASESGIGYLTSGKPLNFGEGYNKGIDFFSEKADIKYIILSANDIIVPKSLPGELLATYLKHKNLGCVMPYLTKSDYYLQNESFFYRNRYVPLMTLNCNFFNKADLVSIGRVPEYLSGYFNDVVMSHNIHNLNKRIIISKKTIAIHLVSRTVSISSLASHITDWEVFKEKHGDLSSKKLFLIKAKKFSSGKLELFFSSLITMMPLDRGKLIINDIYYMVYDVESILFKILKTLIPTHSLKLRSKVKNDII